MNDLIDFLKGLILTTVQIDKKYRETVPELILRMKAVADSSDENPRRKKKPRKMKLGKDGLYPSESESICAWWQANKPELGEDAVTFSKPQINSHASLLRSRETQLQMILILEILALEKLKTSETALDSNLPTLPGSTDAEDGVMAPPPPPAKKRNKHNLPVLLDVHADRLTIWQSTATDELLLLEDSQASSAHATAVSADPKTSPEPLKDFCVDIILPLSVPHAFFLFTWLLTFSKVTPRVFLSCANHSTESWVGQRPLPHEGPSRQSNHWTKRTRNRDQALLRDALHSGENPRLSSGLSRTIRSTDAACLEVPIVSWL